MLTQNEPMLTVEEFQDEWKEMQPLHRPIAAPAQFPLDALPPVLQSAACKIQSVIQAPAAISGQSILAAAALVAQGKYDVLIDGRVCPVSEFFVTIGESGERKSAIDKVVLAPVRAFEKRLRDKYETEHADYSNKKAAYDEQRRQILADKKEYKSREQKEKALAELGSPPAAPIGSTIIADEPTYEGLVKELQYGYPSVGIFSDEGGRMIGGHAMNSENQLKTAAGLSGFWDGTPVSRLRSGDGCSKLYGRRVAMHLMAQPEVAQMLLSNPMLQGQGLLARFLLSYPETTAGSRMYKAVDLSRDAAISTYNDQVMARLSASLPLVEGRSNELEPRQLMLSGQAKSAWIQFHDDIERRQAPGGDLQQIRAFASKLPEHALRLAADMASFAKDECYEISKVDIERGIEVGNFYLSEHQRLFQTGATDPQLLEAHKLLMWALGRCQPVISLIESYQRGPKSIRAAKDCRRLYGVLMEHGYVKPSASGVLYDGRLCKEAWLIRPELLDLR
jgi:hypothetical protein